MPYRFGLTGDEMVRNSVANAVAFLWSGAGVAHVQDLKLRSSGQHLLIPDAETLLLMGESQELVDELTTVKAAGADRFANVTQDGGIATMRKFGARKTTTEGGKGVVPHTVTLVALHAAGATRFDPEWKPFGVSTPHITIDDLIAELPEIKKRG